MMLHKRTHLSLDTISNSVPHHLRVYHLLDNRISAWVPVFPTSHTVFDISGPLRCRTRSGGG